MQQENRLICSNCGTEVGDADKFCKNCGQPLQENDSPKFCPSCGKETEPNANFCANCGYTLIENARDFEEVKDFNSIVQNLGNRGESLLANNISSDETIYVKLKGSLGEGFVVTDKRVYVLKWGYMTGNTFGGRCLAFELRNVTSIEFKKKLATGTVEVLTPATQNAQKSYWGQGANSALKSDNVITFQRSQFKHFQKGVNIARDIISTNL